MQTEKIILVQIIGLDHIEKLQLPQPQNGYSTLVKKVILHTSEATGILPRLWQTSEANSTYYTFKWKKNACIIIMTNICLRNKFYYKKNQLSWHACFHLVICWRASNLCVSKEVYSHYEDNPVLKIHKKP